jgi:hypothetical protein
MSDEDRSTRPAFSAPLWAAARQGAKELAQALPALPDSIRPVEEPGSMGNPTQQMVTEEARSRGDYKDLLARYDSRTDGPDDPNRGIER